MRIILISDAWSPQVNGVVRTLRAVAAELEGRGHRVCALTPLGRRTIAMPFYPEIRLSLVTSSRVGAEIDAMRPDAIHIATEGPLGWAARLACVARDIPFTTSFHTRFADYAAARIPLPGVARLSWIVLREFHQPSAAVMAPTPTVALDLERRGFVRVRRWTRGVDPNLFHPYPDERPRQPAPVLLYAGRLAVEKGVEDFLRLQFPGTKLVVGDGPDRQRLERRFPAARFLGMRTGEDYARVLASADVLVFPSRSDTFGLVMIEAMACGTPVAAYRVASPVDVVDDGVTGCLRDGLEDAVRSALRLDRLKVAAGSARFRWEHAADLFQSWLKAIDPQAWRQRTPAQGPIHLR